MRMDSILLFGSKPGCESSKTNLTASPSTLRKGNGNGSNGRLVTAQPEPSAELEKKAGLWGRGQSVSTQGDVSSSSSSSDPLVRRLATIEESMRKLADSVERIDQTIAGMSAGEAPQVDASQLHPSHSPQHLLQMSIFKSFRKSKLTEEEEAEREAEEAALTAAEDKARDSMRKSGDDGRGELGSHVSSRFRKLAAFTRGLGRLTPSKLSVDSRVSRVSSTFSLRSSSEGGESQGRGVTFGPELGSLELFGDLYEGGHPGHTTSEGSGQISWGVLLPWSHFLLTWDLVCSSALLGMCFYLPFRLSFLSEQTLSWPGDAWLLVIDAIYLLDVGVAMSTAYYDYQGNLEARRSYIVRRYMRGWMLLDLVACSPFDWVYLIALALRNESPNSRVLLGLRALRLGRALRLTTHRRVFTYLSHVFSRLKIRASYLTILQRTIITIIFAHCNCCLQFLVAVLAGLPDDSWVVRAEIHELPVATQYVASVFHTISQMLAVGNGLVRPVRDSEYVTFIISLVLGANL